MNLHRIKFNSYFNHHAPLYKILELMGSLFKYTLAYLIYRASSKKYPEVCLVGSNYGCKKSDNASALFDHILKQKKHKVYFVENRPKGENAIKRGSLKSFLFYFQSDGLFYSHSLSDILPHMQNVPFLFRRQKKPLKVFIQHGMTGLKVNARYMRKIVAVSNYVVAVSEFEKSIIMKFGVPESKIAITGFPVHDDIGIDVPLRSGLIFFTWQNRRSVKNKKIDEVVKHIEILKLFREYQYELIVHHHDMNPKQNYRIGVDGKKTTDDSSLQKAINEAQFMITDNSSVAWEFVYRDRDVIFYKPNTDIPIDLRNIQFHVADTIDELLTLVESVLLRKLPINNELNIFSFKDQKNCERVYRLIKTH